MSCIILIECGCYSAVSTPFIICNRLVAERSKARVYGRSLAGIAGSNLAGGMDVSFVSAVCCKQVSLMDGVLLTVVCHCV